MSDRYPLVPFRVSDEELIGRIIETYPLATVISRDARPEHISLLPLIPGNATGKLQTLTGHLDANNPHAEALVPGEQLSFVFHGPNAYASPDLYPDAHLPGWLYIAVKGAGRISRNIAGPDAIGMLCEASTRFGGSAQRFSLTPDDSRFALFINGIVGFEIAVEEVSCIAKLAQDKGSQHARIASQYLHARVPDGQRKLLDDLLALAGEK